MKTDKINRLVRDFLHGDMPEELQRRFRRWMTAPAARETKDAALFQAWKELLARPAERDYRHKLPDIHHRFDMRDRAGKKSRFISLRRFAAAAALLARLRRHGCRAVELGIQSLSDTALQASERHYSGRQATEACRLVRDAGLALGVQLLPGMPGHQPEDFLADVRRALDLGADMLRFYPCLVLAGAELARRWQQGLYAPWPLPRTLSLLARGGLYARRAGVPVIRMGLAPEPGMEAALLAGPADRNLGGRVLGRALWLHVCACLLRTRGDDAARSEVRAAALLHALLAGGETFALMSIFGLEYAPLLAVLVGVTNIVPVLGPFLGAVPGLIILLLELPWKAAEFAIIIFVVQQVDGNFIAPRILGGATGLPGLGVLLAIVVGGAGFGIPGMVLGVPTLAVLAALLKQAVGAGLTARGLDENGEPRRNLPGGPQEN